MKKRRLGIVVFMFVAILCLGVGFATLTDDLFVDGTLLWDKDAAEDSFTLDVYFADPSVEGNFDVTGARGTNTITASRSADSSNEANDKLTIAVAGNALAVAGESATIKAKVQNDSADSVTISVNAPTTVDNSADAGLFKVECSCTNEAIASKASGEVIIKITLMKTQETSLTVAETFSFTLTAATVH